MLIAFAQRPNREVARLTREQALVCDQDTASFSIGPEERFTRAASRRRELEEWLRRLSAGDATQHEWENWMTKQPWTHYTRENGMEGLRP